MKIGIIGATGKAGVELFLEAQKRGHEVTAIVRNGAKARDLFGADVALLEKDAFTLTREELLNFDVIIDAFGVPLGTQKGYLHLDLATHLIHELRETDKPRIVFILGAASLLDGDQRLLKKLQTLPNHEQWIDVPESQFHELNFLNSVQNVNWVGVSPQRDFVPGARSGYVRGTDKVMYNAAGKSQVTTGNMAVAILDEIEHPQVSRERFTVGDK
ncbi:NAD(P)H-binding protein [Agrilactobacillus fermenti]|uniref:NAD(P)H-binding protein n=1 Tax=Agrilactobacillus fermenti TaxID=2586909 RepID=UPI003A5BDC73